MTKKAKLRFKIDIQRVEIEKLQKDISVLIEQPNSVRACEIKIQHNIQSILEKAIWHGTPATFSGLVQIIPNK